MPWIAPAGTSACPWTNWVAFSVERDGLTTDFQFPGMEPGSKRWEGDLALGEHELAVRAEDPDGRPAAAQLALWLLSPVRAEIRQARAESLPIGESGEARIPALPAGSYEVRATFGDGAEVLEQVALPRSGVLVLRSPEVGALDVLVRHADGRAAAGFDVQVLTWIGEGIPPAADEEFATAVTMRRAEVDAEGRVALSGVRAGELLGLSRVDLGGWGGARADGPKASWRLHLARGARAKLELELKAP